MSFQAILLLLLAAVFHSSWNLLSKRSVDKQAFLWSSLVAVLAIFFLPFLLLFSPFASNAWFYILLSGVLESVYFLLLGSAYQRGDLSLVYPLARGSAPLFVTLFAFAFLHEVASPLGIAGIALIVGGIYALHLQKLDRQGLYAPLLSLRERPSQLALLTGLTIASYSVVDKVGVTYVSPLLYIYCIFLVTTLLLAPYMLIVKSSAVVHEWRVNMVSILAVAALNVAAFLLVLTALSTSKVSYVSSVREVSLVFAALLGAFALREPFGEKKVAGSILIFSGIVCVALAR